MFITGIDEVGRGAIAGPIISASFTINTTKLTKILSLIEEEDLESYSKVLTKKYIRLKDLVNHDLKYLIEDINEKDLTLIEKVDLKYLIHLDDSKKVTSKRRNMLFEVLSKVGEYKLGIVDNTEIDKTGIQDANYKSMINTLPINLNGEYIVLTDHFNIKNPHTKKLNQGQTLEEQAPLFFTDDSSAKFQSITKGDSKSFAIAAASIIAKVSRDRIMHKYHEEFPHFGFNNHVGYGTKQHLDAIKKHGPCKIHRVSYSIFQ